MKKWCKHIFMQPGVWTEHRWRMLAKKDAWRGEQERHVMINVPRSWRVCPICQTERPTKSNRKAAAARYAMDNDQ